MGYGKNKKTLFEFWLCDHSHNKPHHYRNSTLKISDQCVFQESNNSGRNTYSIHFSHSYSFHMCNLDKKICTLLLITSEKMSAVMVLSFLDFERRSEGGYQFYLTFVELKVFFQLGTEKPIWILLLDAFIDVFLQFNVLSFLFVALWLVLFSGLFSSMLMICVH